jgi:D-alanyl-D-alanine carboxypeptidase
MLHDCRSAGYSPLVCSSYRTWEKQTTLFSNLLEKYRSQGLDEAAAYTAAAAEIAPPGTSEHQLGLALDIVSSAYQVLDENQADTPVQQWLMAHSWEYGFILRYPQDKSDFTGIIYEPWHYRYVGREAAEEIHRSGLCLEEFLAQIQ